MSSRDRKVSHSFEISPTSSERQRNCRQLSAHMVIDGLPHLFREANQDGFRSLTSRPDLSTRLGLVVAQQNGS